MWLLYAGTVLLLLAGNETGFRLGRWRRGRMPEGEKAPATAIMGSTLGLLAFMLAFTFGMSGTRFDARKQLVLDEASAVLRAYQRAQLLPEPQRSECSRLASRVCGAATPRGGGPEPLRGGAAGDARRGHPGCVVEGSRSARGSTEPRPGHLPSVASELTDLQIKRVRAAVWNRIPPAILTTLYGIAFLALSAMGYGAGLAESRTAIPSLMLILVFSAIIVLIVDLERPRQQLFQVSQEPMADVARRIQALRH